MALLRQNGSSVQSPGASLGGCSTTLIFLGELLKSVHRRRGLDTWSQELLDLVAETMSIARGEQRPGEPRRASG